MSENETSANINNLQEALLQQQQKIAALREMVQKSDNAQQSKLTDSATTDKVRNINKKLNELKAKAKGGHYSGGGGVAEANISLTELDLQANEPVTVIPEQPAPPPSSGSEKVLLLRQQMEQNKLRLAQRASSKLHLEQLVSELKEKLDSTQQCLDDTTELGKSMTDLSVYATLTSSNTSTQSAVVSGVANTTPTAKRREQRHRSATDLSSQQGFNLEKERIKFLENRCRLLEKQLEKEKQAASQAAAQLKTTKQVEIEDDEHLKRTKELENRITELEQLLQVKEQEIEAKGNENSQLQNELQQNAGNDDKRINLELENDQLRSLELERLRQENSNFKARIRELEDINDVLETARSDLAASNSEYREKLQQMENQLQEAEDAIKTFTAKLKEHEKAVDSTNDSSNNSMTLEDTESRVCKEMAKQIQELQSAKELLISENDELQKVIADNEKLEVNDEQITAKIINLEATIESQRDDLTARQADIAKLEEELMEKTIELNVLNANFRVLEEKLQSLSKTKSKALFSTAGSESIQEGDEDLKAENLQLKQKLDESNKAMIKLKLKCKQTEKEMEKLKKSSKLHAEMCELQKANENLQQRITELEDEKGQWQLQQMESETKDSPIEEDDNNLNEIANKKSKIETIQLLEKENQALVDQIASLQKELKQTQTQERIVIARVESELSDIQLEEQLEEQKIELASSQQQLLDKTELCDQLCKENEELQRKKRSLENKLDHYINENIELLDKLEKLSKSSSSAESIEIVDRLTQQEHAEMAELNKQLERSHSQSEHSQGSHQRQHVDELTQTEIGYELSDSLLKLREESSELMNKVAMFTAERHEVLEKMEQLKTENHSLKTKIEGLKEGKQKMEDQIAESFQKKAKLKAKLEQLYQEKEQLSTQVAESSAQKAQLSGELTSMQKSSEIVAALDNSEGCANLFEKCEKSLSKLDTELEAYKRANDKNAKFNASKKLAKEAKNAYIQLSELLQKVKEASTAVETVTVVETVVAVTAPNGKALAEYEQLTAQNRELKATVEELRSKVHELEDASVHETLSEMVEEKSTETAAPKIVETEQENQRLTETLSKLQTYEAECLQLKATVDELRLQLSELNLANEVKTGEITRLETDFTELRKISNNLESLLEEKESAFEEQAEKFTCLRKELEGKCEVYQGELEILQTLVTEQKQQLIEAYKEHEHEMNLKMLDLQQRDEEITKLRSELTELRQASRAAGAELSDNLEKECERLREALRINKALTAEQINELANKQETIDMLNQQLIELYKTMEENTNKVIEKEDEIADLETTLATNNAELERLRKDNEEQKSVVDKLLNELHSHKENKQQIMQLEHEVQALNQLKLELEQANKELEKRSKEQLERMKKFAANLKKRTTQCQELEAKLKEFEFKGGESELQQELNANVVLLNERISDYELKTRTLNVNLSEIQEALQAKTIELLESMENVEKLENDLKEVKHELMQRDEAIVQLKNALAASQELTAAANDWGEDNKQIEELNEELEKVQADLLEVRELLLAKEQAVAELTEALKTEQTLSQRNEELNAAVVQYTEALKAEQASKKQIEEQFHAKSLKFEKSKAVIKDRNSQIQKLQSQLRDLQKQLAAQPEELPIEAELVQQMTAAPPSSLAADETVSKTEHDALKAAYEALKSKYNNEKSNFEITIERLETLHDGIQAKLQQDMAYIESLEQENFRFKEKICKLEECVASFEDRRASMERRVHVLDAQMHQRADEYVKAEDELIYRLNMLSDHDEVIAQRLVESQERKDELQERLDQLQLKYADLTTQYNKLEKEHKHFQEQTEKQADSELQTMKQQLALSQTELQRQRSQYDAKLAAKTTELDELESELSEQLARNNAEKRALQEDLEKTRDNCTALQDEIVRLKESLNAVELTKQESERELTWLRMQNENAEQQQYEMQSMRMQSMQDKTELENLHQQIEALTTNHQAELDALRLQSLQDKTELDNQRQQLETLSSNHQAETDALRLQIAELDSLRMQVGQNQTDDQVFIESENKRLAELLQERDAMLADYQRQNLQLQMAAAAAATSSSSSSPHSQAITRNTSQQPPDLFASIGAESTLATMGTTTSNLNLEQDLIEKTHQIASLQRDLESLREANTELQMELFEKNQQIETLNRHNVSDNQLNLPQQSSPQEIIPAPPMFFAASQMVPSPFDEIVQRRYEQPNLSAASTVTSPNAASFELPTIEDLQRNVSDLEKYNQELENKLATRNNTEDEMRQRLRQSEHQVAHLTEQLQITSRRYEELEQQQNTFQMHVGQLEALLKERDEQLEAYTSNPIQGQLEDRIAELETNLRTREEQLEHFKTQAAEVQMSAAQITELENRVFDLEQLLKTTEAENLQLQQKLEEERKLKLSTMDLEAQILPMNANAEHEFQQNLAPSLDMFFGNTTEVAFEDIIKPPALPEISAEPVIEDLIVPEKAYVCHPAGDEAQKTGDNTSSMFDDLTDVTGGWGGDDNHWGSTEAAAEEQHFAQNQTTLQTKSLLSNEQQLELQLQAANERIKELEACFANEETQRKRLQEKLAKSMKIVGKYKAQNEELKKKEPSSGTAAGGGFFDDLDAAIQDELKSQVSRLEAALEEQRKIQQEAVLEKEKLLKRIDVLTAGNERMAEMKERQDMDMEMYKTRIHDLQQKLNKLDDWGTGTEGPDISTKPKEDLHPISSKLNEEQKELEARINSLAVEIVDLKGDKQELQALLDEERANVARTEQVLQAQNLQLQKDLEISQTKQTESLEANSELQQELKTLQQDLNTALIENEKLRLEITKANCAENMLENKEVNDLKEELEQAQEELFFLKQKCENIAEKLEDEQKANKTLGAQNLKLQEELEELKIANATLTSTNNKALNTDHDELVMRLQEKETEILHLKQRVEDLVREDQTEKLVLEILSKNQEIHMLKMQVKHLEDDKHELEHNLSLQITKDMQQQKQQQATTTDQTKSNEEALQKKIKELQDELSELQKEKRQMEEELNVLNAHVMGSLELEDKLKTAALDLDMKNIEIKELRQTLESLKTTAPLQTASTSDVDVTALNGRWESLVEQRCNEIAQMWRAHLEQRENEFQNKEQRLQLEIESLQQKSVLPATTATTMSSEQPPQRSISIDTSAAGSASSTPASTISATTSADSSSADGTPLRIINEADADEIITKMQAALENQEIEIVSLKEQLAIRSAEYARLAAQYDPFKLQSGSVATTTVSQLDSSRGAAESNSTMVPKSELDLALYMLHQRDMRCEEMTMELVALMEERDILQLKLSNTLRQVETIKSQTNFVEANLSYTDHVSSATSPTIAMQSTTDSPAKATTSSPADDSTDELHQKLSQLQTVNHSKDKIIKEERERRNRQMERIQQDVAKIPTAAVSELIGADISQTSQTPSSALLNWLWGNKPPTTGDNKGSAMN